MARLACIALLLTACSAGGTNGVDAAGGSGAVPVVGVGTGGSLGSGNGTTVPDETEQASSFRAPVVSGHFLWSANPKSGRVALIDAQSLTTRVVSAGLLPTHLAALPAEPEAPEAIVLNTGSSDATLMRLEQDRIATEHVPTHQGANRWAIAPSGGFAAAWSAGDSSELDPTDGLQEATLIELLPEGLEARRLTVGYRPEQVSFDEANGRLIVVARRGVSLIDLATGDDQWVELDEHDGRDVSISADGKHALVSFAGSETVELVPLDSPEERIELGLPGPMTDLDLASSGRAVAVVRDQSLIATFLVGEVLSDPSAIDTQAIPGELIGSVELTAAADRAVLFTNALDSQRVSIVELEPGAGYLSYRALDTHTSVQSVETTPSGAHALTVGRGIEGASSGSFSILSLTQVQFPRVVGTGALVQQVVVSDRFGVVTAASEDGRSEAHLVVLSELAVETIRLASPPIAAGIVPDAELGFVSQDHPEGRITFFGFSDGATRTLTGFELSADVVER